MNLSRAVRLTALTLLIGTFGAASLGAACNETVGPSDDAQTGGGPSKHPQFPEGDPVGGGDPTAKMSTPGGSGDGVTKFEFSLREGTPDAGSKPMPPAIAASPLSDAQLTALRATLKATLGKDVAVTPRVDAGILGGLIVKVGSRMIDSSLRTKLETLKVQLNGTGA